MKKTILITLLTLVSLALQAQNITAKDSTVLAHIYQTNKTYRSIQANFRHDRIANGTTEHKYGTYYCEKVKASTPQDVSAKIAMRYTTPKGEYYVITPTHLHNGINGHNLHFNYKYVPLMKQLGNAMACAVTGDVLTLYANFNVNFQLTANDKQYTITLTSKNGFNKGVSKLVLRYDKATCLINYLEMVEKTGTTHRYYMGTDSTGAKTHPLVNTPIDASVYVVK